MLIGGQSVQGMIEWMVKSKTSVFLGKSCLK